jgi:hypothetical protein
MTNHPNRNAYNRMLAKLDRISVNGKHAPDVRRLANQESQYMRVAMNRPMGNVRSGASYYNLYGNDALARKQEDEAAIASERTEAMAKAMQSAEDFVAAWGL